MQMDLVMFIDSPCSLSGALQYHQVRTSKLLVRRDFTGHSMPRLDLTKLFLFIFYFFNVQYKQFLLLKRHDYKSRKKTMVEQRDNWAQDFLGERTTIGN